MKQKLSKATKGTLKKASRAAVEKSCGALRGHFANSRWIGAGNRYRKNVIGRLKLDCKQGQTTNDLHLSQYIAASSPLHCADGWAFLGRAIDCHARRDYDSARHFAYYAELRAAMSILAEEGIGIFDKNHFVVEVTGSCAKFGGNTHKSAWQTLEYWAELVRSTELLQLSIRIGGITLKEWLAHYPLSGSFTAVGTRWLKAWGLDLRSTFDDQDARNESSYRPTKLAQRSFLEVPDSTDFILAFWSLCEPTTQSKFSKLDQHLLRLALEEIFKGVTGSAPAASATQYKEGVTTMLAQMFDGPAVRDQWLGFLTRSADPDDPLIISEARKNGSVDSQGQHLQIISRAYLLLRVASAASSRLLNEASVPSSELKFWWGELGEERGLWEHAKEPEELMDLWADVALAVTGMQEWRAGNQAGTFFQWRQEGASDISVLGGCERIALWGLGL
jgi:hypothetical protein